jgi:hypothetical protein
MRDDMATVSRVLAVFLGAGVKGRLGNLESRP